MADLGQAAQAVLTEAKGKVGGKDFLALLQSLMAGPGEPEIKAPGGAIPPDLPVTLTVPASGPGLIQAEFVTEDPVDDSLADTSNGTHPEQPAGATAIPWAQALPDQAIRMSGSQPPPALPSQESGASSTKALPGPVPGARGAADIAVDGKELPTGSVRPDLANQAADPPVTVAAPLRQAGVAEEMVTLVQRRPDAPVMEPLTPAHQALGQERVVETVTRPVANPQSAHLALSSALGSREWAGELGQRVAWMASQRLQVAEIAINPPNLGGVEVRLSMQDSSSAGAQFYASNPEVRSALENAMPRLRDLLAEAGITLVQAEVSDQSFARSQAESGEASGRGGRGTEGPASQTGGAVLPRYGQGLIDLYA